MKKHFIFITVLLMGCSLKNDYARDITSIQSDLRIAEKKINDRLKLILLGSVEKRVGHRSYNIKELGFKAKSGSMESIAPKFLFVMIDNKIKTVHSFELKNAKIRDFIPAMESSSRAKRSYLFSRNDKIKKKLPKEMLDVDRAPFDKMKRSIVDLAISGATYTPLSVVGFIVQSIREKLEEKRNYQSSYLDRIVRLTLLDDHFPELETILGRDNLWDLGSSLDLRYHDGGPVSTLFATANNKIDLYKVYWNLRQENMSKNLSRFIQRANEEGLIAIPITHDFGILYADRESNSPIDHYQSFLLDIDDPIEYVERFKHLSIDKGRLVPLGLFSFREESTPLKLLDYNDPLLNSRRESLTNIVNFSLDLGLSILPFNSVKLGINISRGIVNLTVRKSGSTVFGQRLRSEAELSALLETGVVEFNQDDVLNEAYVEQMKSLDLDPSTIEKYRKKLVYGDSKDKNRAIREILNMFRGVQTEKRIFSAHSRDNIEINRYNNWIQLKSYLNDNEKIDKLIAKFEKKVEKLRRPAEESSQKEDKYLNRPAILFLVDALRPDRFKRAMNSGLMPNLKNLFQDNGVELNSYSSRSLTLPSWGTILTGFDPDEHGVRSNNPIARSHGDTRNNFTDARQDFLNFFNLATGRSYNHLKESDLKWLPDYFDREESILNYMPYNDKVNFPFKEAFKELGAQIPEITYGSFSGALSLDKASAKMIAKKIKKNPGHYKFIAAWFSSVDVMSHHNNAFLEKVYIELDKALGKVIEAAKNDPILKDAPFYLISDHGMSGGVEPLSSPYNILGKKYFLHNTGLNLTNYFAGDFVDYSHYNFVVKTFESPRPDHDMGHLKEFLIHPFSYIYRGKRKSNKGDPNILIDYAGDALAQIYVKHMKEGWKKRVNYHHLTHYSLKEGEKIDLVKDLLNLKLKNVAIFNQKLRKKIKSLNNFHPVKLFAMSLYGDLAMESIKKQLNIKRELTRRPIFVRSYLDKMAIILTSKSESGETIYSYRPLSFFEQDESGRVILQEGSSVVDDVFQYSGSRGFGVDYIAWRSERKILSELKDHPYPNAIVSMTKILTLGDWLKSNPKRREETPDFLITSNLGFNFNSSYITEGDHGAFTSSQIKNTFYIGSFNKKIKDSLLKYNKEPVLTKDIAPTILDFSGMDKNSTYWYPQWRSVREKMK